MSFKRLLLADLRQAWKRIHGRCVAPEQAFRNLVRTLDFTMKEVEKNMTEQKVFENIEDVKCPYCGNPVNCKHFSHWQGEDACFIAECWSGDTRKDEPIHLFKIWVKIDKEVTVLQKV